MSSKKRKKVKSKFTKLFKPNLSVRIGRLLMKNPVMVASGCFGYGEEMSKFYSLNHLGAIVVKGTTLEPRLGNQLPRMAETPSGMLNSIGLQNVGVEKFLKEKLPFLKKQKVPIVVNINGKTKEEYVLLAKKLDSCDDIKALEINISCPNVKEGGIEFGSSALSAFKIVQAIRKVTKHTLITKLSPNVSSLQLKEIAQACVEAGSEALSAINTVLGMAVDLKNYRPALRSTTGGLSGPAIKPIGLRVIYELHQVVSVPLIGMGGILSVGDALEYLLVGSAAVAIGTGNYINPFLAFEVVNGINEYFQTNQIETGSDFSNRFKAWDDCKL
jgi:dihydroorotate dehydrogenase (NAD+) catalytic subunit